MDLEQDSLLLLKCCCCVSLVFPVFCSTISLFLLSRKLPNDRSWAPDVERRARPPGGSLTLLETPPLRITAPKEGLITPALGP